MKINNKKYLTNKLLKSISLVFIFVAFISIIENKAQTYLMDGTNITDCQGVFFDSGGSGAGYAPNENFTTTICADGSGGTHINLAFGSIDLMGDILVFHDGPDVTAPILATAGDFDGIFNIQATAANPSGCLTITFTSDGSNQGIGWAAAITCVAQCQTVNSEITEAFFIDPTNGNHIPAIVPVDTGWIDVCIGERVYLTGQGVYPQNNLIYAQSDNTSILQWEYGDGSFSYGLSGSHMYTEPGGYIIQLHVEDVQGCKNTNIINQRVRVSGRPSFNVGGDVPDQVCVGDTITLAGITNTIDTNYNISIIPDTGSFSHIGILSDTLNLPDGAGVAYESSILLNDFSPGQVLTDPADFIQICAVMEHSFLADISVTLIAPDGTQIVLEASHNGWGAGGVFMGEPVDASPDNSVPGVGYEYCWSATSPLGTWFTYINNGGATPNNTLPPGAYGTEDPISDLIGVPLNGEWTISVLDDWGSDDGWIFQWFIEFNEDLYPNVETYVNYIVDHRWTTNPSVIFYEPDSIIAFPQNAGLAQYFYEVRDTFGCIYDTSIVVPVLPPTHPDCHTCDSTYTIATDTSICTPVPINLTANYETFTVQEVGFETFPLLKFSSSNAIIPPTVESTINVTSVNPGILVDINDFIKVCFNIETTFDSDMDIYLISPNGSAIELTTDNGGSGDNYENTCFSLNAATSITTASPPFLGEYLPEGDLNALVGSPINGDWKLQASDDGGIDISLLLSWSIHFNTYNNVDYTWTSTETVDCPTCDTTTSTPLANAVYDLSITDIYGCQFNDQVTVDLGASAPAPILACDSMSGGNIFFTWDEITGATGYEVNVNSTGWQVSSTDSLHPVTGLSLGDIVNLQIVTTGLSGGTCVPDTTNLTCIYDLCNLSLTIADTTQVSCFGGNDGTALITVMDANLPATYTIDDGPSQANGIFNAGLMAGEHKVIVTDNEGCKDSIFFTLTEPTQINLSTTVDSVSCSNGNDGQANVVATGGAPGYTYVWNTFPVQTTDTLKNVSIGNYTVTVQDLNGCTETETVEIFEPLPLLVGTAITNTQCFNSLNGAIEIGIIGGTPDYTASWTGPDGYTSTDIDITGIIQGTYTYIITDNNNCVITADLIINAPPELNISDTTHTAVTCFGGTDGTATVIPTGGTAPLTVLWGNTETSLTAHNLPAGPITCTVTDDNLCSVTFIVTVTQPATTVFLDTINLMNQSCFGFTDGNIQLIPNNVVLPVNYSLDGGLSQLSNQFNNLTTGIHEVILFDDIGCTDSIQFEITEPTEISLSTTTDSVSCFGGLDGSATVSAIGGTLSNIGDGYTYLWNTLPAQITSNLNNVGIGTYSVLVSDANSCSQTASIEIFQPTTINIMSAAQNVQCWYADDGSINNDITGGTPPYTTHWEGPDSYTSEDEDITGLAVGNYTYTVTDANDCTYSDDVDITSPLAIDTMNTSSTPLSCFGGNDGTATIIPSGGTGVLDVLWDNLETTLVAHNLPAGMACGTITDDNNCSVSFCVEVEGPPAITLTISSQPTSCFNSIDGTAQVVASGGTTIANYSYLWDNNVTTANAFGLDPGNHCVTVTDDNGCMEIICVDVLSADSLIIDNITINPTLCYNTSTGSAEVFVHGGSGNYSYLWSQGSNINENPVVDLSYGTVVVTITDENSCSVVASGDVERPDELFVNFDVTDILCNGDNSGSLTAIPIGGTAPYTFLWSNSDMGAVTDSLLVGNYIVTVTDANLCTTIENKNVNSPNPIIVLDLIQTETPCFGDSNGEAYVEGSGGSGNFTYQWGDELMQVGAIATNLSNDYYFVTATDDSGCQQFGNVLIEQYDSIITTLLIEDPSCFEFNDGSITLDQISGGSGQGFIANYDYTWSTIPQIHTSVLNQIEGNITYYLSIIDNKGCNTVVEAILGEPNPILISDNVQNALCYGSDDGIIEVNATGDLDSFIYTWGDNAGNVMGDSIGGLFANTYIVTAMDTNNCFGLKTIIVEQPLELEANYDIQNVNCNGGTNAAILVQGEGGTPNYNYLWGDSTTFNSISDLGLGIYYVTLTDRNDCVLLDSIIIEEPTPQMTTLTADAVTCFDGHDGFIYIDTDGGIGPYTYSVDGENFNGSSTQIGLASGSYNVYVQDKNGCIDTNNVYIGSPPEIEIDLGPDHIIFFEASTLLEITSSTGVQGSIVTYDWVNESPDSIVCQGGLCEQIIVTPPFTSTYLLTVQDEFGCVATDYIKVIVEQARGTFVPSGFSPNGDFMNDLLHVHGLPETVVKHFAVYDKWGEKIYEDGDFMANDLLHGWNGTFKGKPVMPGVYLYTVEVVYKDGFEDFIKGSTTLIK